MLVRRATSSDLLLIDHLRRKESESLGFVPFVAYERVLNGSRPDQRIWIVEENTDAIGFLYATGGAAGASAHIQQVVVRHDARRLEFASALVTGAEEWATARQRQGLTCRVATDIPATEFWDALGFAVHGYEPGGKRRQRTMQRRYKPLAVTIG